MISEAEIKRMVLKIFDEVRENPSETYEASHFLDFLCHPPAEKHTIRNSFKGARLAGRFIDKIELEFAICFKKSEWGVNYSLDEFVQKIKERISKRKGNMIIIRQRKHKQDTYMVEVVLALILGFVWYGLGISWIAGLLSVLSVGVFGWLIWNKIRNRRHNNALYKKIMDLS